MSCQIRNGKYYAPNGKPSNLHKQLLKEVSAEQAEDLFVLANSENFKKVYPLKFEPQEIFGNRYKGLYFKDYLNLFTNEKSNSIELELIQIPVEQRGRGLAEQQLREFLAYTDSLGKDVVLTISPRDNSVTFDGLVKLYQRNGFVFNQTDFEMIRYRQPSSYDQNGEPKFRRVIDFARNINETQEPLTADEQLEIKQTLSEFPKIPNTIILQKKLEDAFYNNGFFSPTRKQLERSELYLPSEIEIIMSDLQVQAKVKETIEKLKRTDVLENDLFIENPLSDTVLNSIGKYKAVEEEDTQELANIQIIDEQGNIVQDKFTYIELIKPIDNPLIFQAIDAIEEAYENLDTSKVEAKLKNWLLDYGIKIEHLTKESMPYLRDFLFTMDEVSLEVLSDVLDIPHTPRQKNLKIKNTKRDLVYLETLKNEEQLFEELDLIATETPNVYHRIERVDMQELKNYLEIEDNSIKEYELYKEYFGYKNSEVILKTYENSPITTDSIYLKTEFVSDFYIEQLKNPNNEFYKLFEVNETGIYLKDTKQLQTVLDYIVEGSEKYSKELSDYSIISRHLPNLKITSDRGIKVKQNLLNNPHLIKNHTSEIINIDPTTVFLKNASEELVKVGNTIYEFKGTEGNKSLYSKVEFEPNLNYFIEYKEKEDYTDKIEIPTPKIEQYNKINRLKGVTNNNFNC